MRHEVVVADGAVTVDAAGDQTARRETEWLVLHPIVKRGRLWQPGEVIRLTRATGQAFEANGDVKEQS